MVLPSRQQSAICGILWWYRTLGSRVLCVATWMGDYQVPVSEFGMKKVWGEEHWWCCSPHAVCWCPGQESNLHASRHTHLKRARLPIPPPGHLSSLHERKTRLELATPTLARLCSTNWAISANESAKTSSGMSPNEISFSVSQCFAVQLSCLRLQRYTFFFIQQTFPYSFLRNNPKFLA